VYDPDKQRTRDRTKDKETADEPPKAEDKPADVPLHTLTVGEKKAWWGISQFFLPALFLYFGLIVVLLRRGVR